MTLALVQAGGALVARQTTAAELVAMFLRGRTPTTLRAYGQDLADFARFVQAPDVDAAAAALLSLPQGEANGVALRYRTALVDRGMAPATVNRRLAAVRSLVTLARTLGLVPWALDVDGVRSESYRDTRGPGQDGMRRLMALALSRTDAKGARDVVLVLLMYALGLRRSEVVALDLADVDLDRRQLRVRGKGRTQQTAFTLPPKTCVALRRWLALRGPMDGPLFVALDTDAKGERLSDTSAYRIVRAFGDRLGLRVRPHGLRHCGITAGLDLTNGDVRAVSKFSRHKDLRTVQLYDDSRADHFGRVAGLVDASI